MNQERWNRREVLAGLAAAVATRQMNGQGGQVERRVLGKTGEKVSCLGVGGSHIGKPKLSGDEATRIIPAGHRSWAEFHGQFLGLQQWE